MTNPVNPYIAGPAPRGSDFFGRGDILDSISRELRNMKINSIVLHGQRRIGKTSLLLRLKDSLPSENYVPIYFDLQASLPLKKMLSDLANKIVEKTKIKTEYQNNMRGGDLSLTDSFIDFIENVYHKLDKNKRLVFLFDEFDVLDHLNPDELPETASARALFPFLRGLMGKDAQSVYVFVVGRQASDLSLDFSETFKASLSMEIWVLDSSSANALIRQSEANKTLSFTDAAINRILELTNGHPFFTQLLCHGIWKRAYAQIPDNMPIIDTNNVDMAIDDALFAGGNPISWLWGGLSPAQKIYAAALAEISGKEAKTISEAQVIEVLTQHGRRFRTHEIEIAPKYLVKQRVLEEVEDRHYRFALEMFFRWVQKNKPLKEVKEELDRVDPTADQLYGVGLRKYEKQAYEEACRYFEDALRSNPNHVKARVFLGESYLILSKPDEAVIELKHAWELDSDQARWPFLRALVSLAESKEESDEDAALKISNQALEILPGDQNALNIKVRILIRRGIAAFEQYETNTAWEYFNQAGFAKREDAIKSIRNAVHENPSLYRTRLVLGCALLDLGRIDEAKTDIDEAFRTIYDKPRAEQEEEIEKYIHVVLDKNPHSTFIRQRHGEVLLALKFVDQAVLELELVYHDAPDLVRHALSQALMTQARISIKNRNLSKTGYSFNRLAQITSDSHKEMAEIVTELLENLSVAQPKRNDKSQLNDLILNAAKEVKILGVTALESDWWYSLAKNLAQKIKANPDFELSILCESDNILFSRSLTTDVESAKKRQSFGHLKFIRDQILTDFQEFLIGVGASSDSVKIEIMHLPIPISVIQVDTRIFVNMWLSEIEYYFDEIAPHHSWYGQFQNYIAFYFDPNRGKKYACGKKDEVLELFDHERIPRGIYPRNSFYDTDYDQLVVWGFVFDRKGRLLIHRRADNAKDNQGMWDKSVGGHTDLADYDTSRAIPREVIEELFSEEIKQSRSDFTAFAVNDEDMIYCGEWRPEKRKSHPFDEIRMYNREWAYFRLRDDERIPSPRTLPTGEQRRLRVIADVFLFVAGPQLTDESLGRLKNSTFKLIELTDLKIAMDKSSRGEYDSDFDDEQLPKFSPDLKNVMTGKLRDVFDECSQYIKTYLKK